MQITASLVKELRERTGAGMMECKRALVDTSGDIEAAAELMRKSGAAKADKKAGRVAAEGMIAIAFGDSRGSAAMVEINSETDFVAKGEDFQGFANSVAGAALEGQAVDADSLAALELENGVSVEQARKELIAKVGENIQVRRAAHLVGNGGRVAGYLHGLRIGVIVTLEGGDDQLGKDIAMHIAASNPVCIDESEVPAELLAKERDILIAQAEESGKPANIIEKMIEGRIKKYLAEITLVGQAFVKDPDQSVGKLLEAAKAKVIAFRRFEVGEGIEKIQENFAEEVMAQARGE